MNRRIAVIGAGYLGTTHACCLAELGFEVLGVDIDAGKVDRLSRGLPTFYEPGLADLLARHTDSGQLRFTRSLETAATFADVFFLCVGTPQRTEGLGADTRDVVAVTEQLVPLMRRSAVVVSRCTTPVGTVRGLGIRAQELARPGVEVEVACNPEFLREGHAVEDTLFPSRIVLGVPSTEAEKVLRGVYAPMLDDGVPLVVTDVATAELVKVSANAFLATKISYINAVAELCEATGGDVLALAEALGYDDRIGPGALHPGLGFGGGCLPKDVRAMMVRSGELGVDQAVTLLWQVDAINLRQRGRMVDLAVEQCGNSVSDRRIGVLGAAFKPFTDDVRESPALDVAEQLRRRGAHVSVYDPQANRNAAALAPQLRYVDDVRAAAEGAHVLLHLTEWPEFADLDPRSLLPVVEAPRIVDGRNTLDAERWRLAGWTYRALGRPR